MTQRGFALLIVLWTVVLLTFLVMQLTAAGRTETHIAANLRGSAVAEASADGAVYEALFHLLDGSPQHWEAGNTIHRIRTPSGLVLIQIRSEAGKVDPNTAPPALLTALLRNVGADPQTAATIAAAIVTWRTTNWPPQTAAVAAAQYRRAGRDYAPPGAPFQSLGELGLVLGMTPDLLSRLAPHLSIYAEGGPIPSAADPVVRQAMAESRGGGMDGLDATGFDPAAPVSIRAEAHEADGSVFNRYAVVRLAPATDGRPYQILTWEAPAF